MISLHWVDFSTNLDERRMAQIFWEISLCTHQGGPRECGSQQGLRSLPPRLVHVRASKQPV